MQSLLFGAGALPYAVLTAQRTWRDHGAVLAELTGARAGGRLLDLGCGPGESAFGMAERVPGLSVVGLDLSHTMIRIARHRTRREPTRDRLHFQQGDAMSLPFPDASFDAVTGHSFLYLVPSADRVLEEVRRVLRPGGLCAFLEPSCMRGFPAAIATRALSEPRFVASMALWRIVSRGYGRFDRARFHASFTKAGLELVSAEPTLAGLGLFGVGRKSKGERA